MCVCMCLSLQAQIQSNFCVSSISSVFISFYFFFCLITLLLTFPLLLQPPGSYFLFECCEPTLYRNVQRSPESVVSCQFALPLGWTHSPLHTLYFSSSFYHMALKFPFIFLSSSASLVSSSSVQTWSSSCLAV